MARESCNLDKEEAEILKPSSSPSSSSPSPAHKEEAEIIKPSPPPSTHQSSSSSSSSSSQPQPPPLFMNSSSLQEFSAARKREKPKGAAEEERKPSVRLGNRCSICRRKVGLTGFRCRCGHLFCGQHRYSDTHDCSFDYKAFGREQISKANPAIRAAKIIKI